MQFTYNTTYFIKHNQTTMHQLKLYIISVTPGQLLTKSIAFQTKTIPVCSNCCCMVGVFCPVLMSTWAVRCLHIYCRWPQVKMLQAVWVWLRAFVPKTPLLTGCLLDACHWHQGKDAYCQSSNSTWLQSVFVGKWVHIGCYYIVIEISIFTISLICDEFHKEVIQISSMN